MNEYKCDNHKLNIACLGCIRAWINRHDKMLEFVKEIYNLKFDTLVSMKEAIHNDHISKQAEKILKEIGKLNE